MFDKKGLKSSPFYKEEILGELMGGRSKDPEDEPLDARKVIYLEDSGYVYRGIKIYGSPVCVCRKESEGRRMRSREPMHKKWISCGETARTEQELT